MTVQKNKEELSRCEQDLRRMVDSMADDFYKVKASFDLNEYDDLVDEEPVDTGLKYFEAYSVNYTYTDCGELQGVRVLLAGGGPNIWLDTNAQEVQGFWGSDRYSKYCGNCDYVLDYFEELSPMVKKSRVAGSFQELLLCTIMKN